MGNQELNNQNIQNNNLSPKKNTPVQHSVQEKKVDEQATTEPVLRQHRNKSAFNGKEEVVFTFQEEKEGNPLVPILLFGVLIGMIFLLPLISKKIEFKSFKPEVSQNPSKQEIEEEEFYYFEKTSTRAKIGTLELTNFVKSHEENEYKLSFTINNVGEKSYDYSKKYYIVMYEGNKVIYRALIHSYDGLGALSATTLSLNINQYASNNADRFKLQELPTSTYPEVKTVNIDGDYNVLTCKYNYNTISYYFKDNELYKIYDEYQENISNNPLYNSHKEKYEKDYNKYKEVENLSSIFIETEEDFRLLNDIDLTKISDVTMVQLRTYRFFRFKENIKTVSFEMEAQGYTCG